MKDSWEVIKLGDLCTIQLGKTPHRKTEKFWDKEKETSNVWLSIADMKHGEDIFDSKEYVSNLGAEIFKITPKGTLMLTFKLTLGRVSFAGRDLFTNEAIASLINLNPKISKKYLFYFFTFFNWDKATEGDEKIKGKTMNKAKLKALDIICPPLSEQKQIVAILDKAFAAIDQAKANIEKNIQNAQELFQSKLNEIFSQKGEGWEEITLGEIGEVQTGTTPPTKDKSNYGDFIPFAKPPHFNENGDIVTKDSMLSEIGLTKGRLFKKNSVLMVCIGATIGKTGFSEIPISSNQQINALTPNDDYDPKLLYYALISPFVQNQVISIGRGAQATLPIINKSKWMKLKLNVPKDKTKQSQIVEMLESLKEFCIQIDSNYQNKIDSLEELKKSTLQKAFAGELTS